MSTIYHKKQIVLPVKFDFKWSTYIWDFTRAKILVLDPSMNNGAESNKEIQLKHRKVVDELHKAIELCIKSFFVGWEPDMRLWNTFFPNSLILKESRYVPPSSLSNRHAPCHGLDLTRES